MASKYKLNVARDVDTDEVVHVRSYENMRELRAAIRLKVVPCDCAECVRGLAKNKKV